MSTKVMVWNEVSSTVVPNLVLGQVWRPLLGAPRNVHTYIPGRPGSWVTPGKPGLRHLRVEGYIQSSDPTARREAIEALSDWLDVEGEAHLTISDMPDRYYLATLGAMSDPEEWRETGTFELVWDIQPYSLGETISNEDWSSDNDDNHTFSPTLYTPVWPVIYITPTNGTLTGFTIENNGDTLTVDDISVASTHTIVVNSLVPIVYYDDAPFYDAELTGAFPAASIILVGVSGNFPTLLPDIVNNIHFVKTGGTATAFTVHVEYRASYRS